jgi:hypothetical protein
MKKMAQENGVSHLYLCRLHYSNSQRSFTLTDTAIAYEAWLNPL